MACGRGILLVALLALVGCGPQGGRRPSLTARIKPARVKATTFQSMTLEFDVEFENSSPARLALTGLDYRLLLGEAAAVEGKAGENTTLEPRTTTTVTIEVKLDFGKLRPGVPVVASGGRTTYVLQAVAALSTGEKVANVPLRAQGLLAIPSAAVVELVRLERRQMGVAEGRLELFVGVRNPNPFAITLKQVKAEVHLRGVRVTELDLTPNAAVQPRDSTHLTVPLRLDFRRLGADLYAGISAGEVNVRFAGTARVLTPYGEVTFPLEMARRMPVEQ